MLTDTHRITSSLDLDDYALLAQKASKAYFPIFCSFLCLPRLRDRPFNLKGGGYGFLFRSEFSFRTTQELEYFYLSRGARNLFPEFNIRLYDKNPESDYFFSLHQNQNIFFSNIGNQNIFLEKNHNPPFKLNGRSLTRLSSLVITKWNISWGKMQNVFRSISNTLKLVFPSMMTYPLANIHTVTKLMKLRNCKLINKLHV